jgi:hypothetical protein
MLSLTNSKTALGQRFIRNAVTRYQSSHLAIVRPQTPLKLYPFQHKMSTIAFRAMREDGSGIVELAL